MRTSFGGDPLQRSTIDRTSTNPPGSVRGSADQNRVRARHGTRWPEGSASKLVLSKVISTAEREFILWWEALALSSSLCTGFSIPTIVTEPHCNLTESTVSVELCMFELSGSYEGNGAAVYVDDDSLVTLGSDSFFNCQAGTPGEVRYRSGGCADLQNLRPGSVMADCCATKCVTASGGIVAFWSWQLTVKGIAAFDCKNAYGALCNERGPVCDFSGCNLTSVSAVWDSSNAVTSGICLHLSVALRASSSLRVAPAATAERSTSTTPGTRPHSASVSS